MRARSDAPSAPPPASLTRCHKETSGATMRPPAGLGARWNRADSPVTRLFWPVLHFAASRAGGKAGWGKG